jgi:hypothetical protein
MSALVLSVTAAFAFENAQICVSQEEGEGVLNIRPAEIMANGNHLLSVAGGERKCVEVGPGQYSIIAHSSDPYDPNDTKPTTWKSKALIVILTEGCNSGNNTIPCISGGCLRRAMGIKTVRLSPPCPTDPKCPVVRYYPRARLCSLPRDPQPTTPKGPTRDP